MLVQINRNLLVCPCCSVARYLYERLYRVKAFEHKPKYKQPKNTSNYVYFPQQFKEVVNGHNYVLLTEGEKKAVAATKAGFPTVALSGVDSWRNHTLILPQGTELLPGGKEGSIIVKLADTAEVNEGPYAKGFEELVNFVISQKLHVVICYDTDGASVAYAVQRAAAILGYELRHLGVPVTRIRQLVLPASPGANRKVALDDYINGAGIERFGKDLSATLSARTAFPRHPNISEYINKKLQVPRLDRKETRAVALAVLSDLDARGIRMRSPTMERMYYFDDFTRKLMKATIPTASREQIIEQEFGRLLYQRYGLSAADNRVLIWLATQFSAEDPVEEVEPHRVTFADRNENLIYFQINDGQYVAINGSQKGDDAHLEIRDNGDRGILFESTAAEPMEAAELLRELEKQRVAPLTPWWFDVLRDTRLRHHDSEEAVKFTTLLHYASPWLNRWKGTQLPIELVIGESGSGKSTLCSLRLAIVTGEQALRNAPSDLRDWHASIANAGGIHVIDNVQLTDKNLRQKMSDEICRVVTEPNPHIEMRRLYTNAELFRVPVETTFCITSIQQPFPNVDLIQRAVFIELDKAVGLDLTGSVSDVAFESEWVDKHLAGRGGRAAWIAHHCLVLSRFFALVEKKWNGSYNARHRLINFEQNLMLLAEVFGWESAWIPAFLAGEVNKNISDSDWAMEGLVTYAEIMREALGVKFPKAEVAASDISEWAVGNEQYSANAQMNNARRLGRYMQTHKQMVASLAGLVETRKTHNKVMYRFVAPKEG